MLMLDANATSWSELNVRCLQIDDKFAQTHHLPAARCFLADALAERMVAVASRLLAVGANPISRLSFWKHAVGSDPYENPGHAGSYNRARSIGSSSSSGGGTWGHWAPDTSVDNPHGPGKALLALEYHPRDDVVASAGQDGGFNLWGLKKNVVLGDSLAAVEPSSSSRAGKTRGEGGKGGVGEREAEKPAAPQYRYHWACSLKVRYKTGFSATGLSFCSDGSVLAVAYSPATLGIESKVSTAGEGSRDVITLWSLDTMTLLSTLLPPRGLRLPLLSPSPSPRPLKSVAFLAGSGRVFACGDDYAAVWDLLSEKPTPLWEYRARFLAAATADTASISRSRKGGVHVEGRGFGDVVLCVDAASLAGEGKKRGAVVLLLDSRRPTPLYTWRLQYDNPCCLRLLLGAPASGGKEGVVCLTRERQLLLLSVVPGHGSDPSTTSMTKPKVGACLGLGMVRSKRNASAPALHLANAARQKLLDVDLAAFGLDPALSERGTRKKRPKISGGGVVDGGRGEDDDDGDREDDGHAGGREAALRSGQRSADILDPSSLNLAPVADLYEPFMKTLLKPAPQSSSQSLNTWEANPLLARRGKNKGVTYSGRSTGLSGLDADAGARKEYKMGPVGVDKELLAVLTEEMKAGGSG